jgi:carboxypeptidase C (cathepsin A)
MHRYGGELVSLAIPHAASEAFSSAGYSPIHTNATYTGGQVRQHGNLSFSRVYQAGHEVPAYQPETAYEIFMRVLVNKDGRRDELLLAGTERYAGFQERAV